MMFKNFKTILEFVTAFPDEQSCIDHLEQMRWNGKVVSPFDATSTVYRCRNNRYKCRNTSKYFTVKVGTVFENSNIKLQKWYMALYLFANQKKGISSVQLAANLGVTQKTAWFMLHRLRYSFDNADFKQELEGIVEIDETYIGGKISNKHKSKRAALLIDKSGAKLSTKHTNKEPVLGICQRNGSIRLTHMPDNKAETILPVIYNNVAKGSTIFTDEAHVYKHLLGYRHDYISHSQNQFVNGEAHTNTVEGSFGLLKNNIRGIYHYTSPKHLQSYLNEFSYRYNSRKTPSNDRFNNVLINCAGRLTYKTLIAK